MENNNIDINGTSGDQELNLVETNKADVTPEPVSDCCAAPLYAASIRIGADGKFDPNGTFTNVKKCMCCGDTVEIVGKKPFEIVDEGSADWFMGKLANIRAEQARVKANAAERIEQLDADYNRLYGRYGEQLEAWARNESIARRRKTVTIGNGSIVLRAVGERLVVSSLPDATQTARLICPEAITTIPASEKLDAAVLLKRATQLLQETGEISPGMELKPADETISIKLGAKVKDEPTATD